MWKKAKILITLSIFLNGCAGKLTTEKVGDRSADKSAIRDVAQATVDTDEDKTLSTEKAKVTFGTGTFKEDGVVVKATQNLEDERLSTLDKVLIKSVLELETKSSAGTVLGESDVQKSFSISLTTLGPLDTTHLQVLVVKSLGTPEEDRTYIENSALQIISHPGDVIEVVFTTNIPNAHFILVSVEPESLAQGESSENQEEVEEGSVAEPVAIASGAPVGVSKETTLDIVVSSVTNYRYFIGEGGSVDCGLAENYGAEISAGTSIDDDISGLADGTVTLCLVGGGSIGVWQSFTAATSVSWTKDTSPPTAGLTGAPPHPSTGSALSVIVSGSDEYRYALRDASTDCSGATYSAWRTSSVAITDMISDGSKHLCVIGRDAAGNVQTDPTTHSWAKVTNTSPTFSFIEPDGSGDVVGVGEAFVLTWSDADPDDSAAIDFYYSGTIGSSCVDGTKIAGTEFEDDGQDSKSWISSIVGTFYICARISDGANPALEVWSNPISVLGRPSVDGPVFGYSKTGEQWVYPLTATGGAAPYTFNIESGPGGATINTGTTPPQIEYTPGSAINESFLLSVTDNAGIISLHKSVTLKAKAYATCVWTGATDTDWGTVGNWTSCSGGAPDATTMVVIPSTASVQPTISVSATIEGFGEGTEDGGVLTVNSGVTLTLDNSTSTIGSSITLQGDTTTCSDCRVNAPNDNDLRIFNEARVILKSGITLATFGTGAEVLVEDGAHMEAVSLSANSNEWPTIEPYAAFLSVGSGSSPKPVSLLLNGVVISGPGVTRDSIRIYAATHIQQLDRISINPSFANHEYGYVHLSADCEKTVVSDFNWSDLMFNDPFDGSGTNFSIKVTGCPDLGPIEVSGSGAGFLEAEETDPDGVINWNGSTTLPSNVAPTIALTSPPKGGSSLKKGEVFALDFSASDADDSAGVSLYHRSNSSSGCYGDPAANGWTLITAALSEDMDSSYGWSTDGIASGTYFLCAKVDDGNGLSAGNFSVAPGTLSILPSNMLLWLRADAGVTTDAQGRVGQWLDQSGVSTDASQINAALKPTLIAEAISGQPVIRFDGGDYLATASQSSLNGLSGLTVFAVFAKGSGNPEFAPILAKGSKATGTRLSLSLGGTGYGSTAGHLVEMSDGSYAGSYEDNTLTDNKVTSVSFIYDGDQAANTDRLLANYSYSASTQTHFGTISGTTVADASPIYIGGEPFSAQFRGDIAEILIFSDHLSAGDQQLVSSYLAKKYLGRVNSGLVASYDFNEGHGATVADTSGNGTPLDLSFAEGAGTWVTGGLAISSAVPSRLESSSSATKIHTDCSGGGELTVEAWIEPEVSTQCGPSRIVNMSFDGNNRNFTVAQCNNDNYRFRVRSQNSNSDGSPESSTAAATAPAQLTHLVVTREAGGSRHFYIDGTLSSTDSGAPTGNFSGWNSSYKLSLADELTGASSNYHWFGTYYYLAIYCRALSISEIQHNYQIFD